MISTVLIALIVALMIGAFFAAGLISLWFEFLAWRERRKTRRPPAPLDQLDLSRERRRQARARARERRRLA